MDITKSVEPKSDQQNYDDYITGPKTVTVTEVKNGTAEQPVEVHLVEFPGRPYKPSKSMRRVLIAGWGSEAAKWAGRSLTLYGDPTVKFGKAEVGGIKIAAMSHIPSAVRVNLTVSRGKREPFVVEPLVTQVDESAVVDWVAAMEAAVDLNDLQSAWVAAGESGVTRDPRVIAAKDARKKELVADGES